MIRLALVVPAGVAAEGADDVAVGEAADQEGEQELGGEGEHAEHVAQRPRPEESDCCIDLADTKNFALK